MRRKTYKRMSERSPSELRKDLLDEKARAVCHLWVFTGETKKAAWTFIYKPKCKPISIPPRVSAFFGSEDVKDYIRLLARKYEGGYINPKAYEL
jgi:hypothetical protein